MSAEDLLAQAEQLLADTGIRAPLALAGHASDILVVHAGPAALEALHLASPGLRALGVRYVSIEITPSHA